MTPSSRRRWFYFAVGALSDGCAVGLAFVAAFLLRFDANVPRYESVLCSRWCPVAVLVYMVAICAVTRYRLPWRYAGLTDLRYMLWATVPAAALVAGLILLADVSGFPRSIVPLHWFLALNALMALRVATRLLHNRWNRRPAPPSRRVRRVLVIGAGESGCRIVRSMQEDPAASLHPMGFLDDDETKLHSLIRDVPVRGAIADLEAVMQRHHVDQVLIAIPSMPPSKIIEIVQRCAAVQADVTILPSLPQMLSTDPTTRMIRKVCLEDLLERTPVQIDVATAARYTTGQRILVTGAGGSIGSELCRQIVALRPEALILLGRGENSLFHIDQELREEFGVCATPVIADVRDRDKLETVFREHHPTVVFHAAAHKHVPLMEANPEEAIKNNVVGTRNLAELSVRFGVRTFVLISTDKAVNPTSVMGASKRVAENVVQSLAQRIDAARKGEVLMETWGFDGVGAHDARTRFTAVRFGNVLGSRGSVVPTMQRQIERGGPVTVTHPDMERYFMTIPEAVQLVIQAGGMGRGGEVFVLDMGKPVRIMDLAWNLIRLSGLIPDVDIPVKITGMRPGEKLYEEVLTAEEGVTVTSHEKIYVARSMPVNHNLLFRCLEDLEAAARRGDGAAIRALLCKLIPTYRPETHPAADGTPPPLAEPSRPPILNSETQRPVMGA